VARGTQFITTALLASLGNFGMVAGTSCTMVHVPLTTVTDHSTMVCHTMACHTMDPQYIRSTTTYLLPCFPLLSYYIQPIFHSKLPSQKFTNIFHRKLPKSVDLRVSDSLCGYRFNTTFFNHEPSSMYPYHHSAPWWLQDFTRIRTRERHSSNSNSSRSFLGSKIWGLLGDLLQHLFKGWRRYMVWAILSLIPSSYLFCLHTKLPQLPNRLHLHLCLNKLRTILFHPHQSRGYTRVPVHCHWCQEVAQALRNPFSDFLHSQPRWLLPFLPSKQTKPGLLLQLQHFPASNSSPAEEPDRGGERGLRPP
jgi:hypothetical protein